MPTIRVVDNHGTPQAHEFAAIPRIGERLIHSYGEGSEPIREHYFRVQDVVYDLNAAPENMVTIFVREEDRASLLGSE